MIDLKEVFQDLDPNQMESERITEQEYTPKTLDPYEYAVQVADKLLRTTDSAVTAIEVIKRLAELEKAKQPLPF